MASLTNEQIDFYETWSGYEYDPSTTTIDDVEKRVQDVLDDLSYEADRFILAGELRRIHRTIDPADLDDTDPVLIAAYDEMFYAKIGRAHV